MSPLLDEKLEELGALIPDTGAVFGFGGTLLVQPTPASFGRHRFLTCRCRRFVARKLALATGMREEATLDLGALEQRLGINDVLSGLDTLATNLVASMPTVEAVYKTVAANNPMGRLDLTRPKIDITHHLYEPESYRFSLLWDIVWGMLAIDENAVVGPAGTVISPTVSDAFLEIAERRLRTAERVRYNTSNPLSAAPHSLLFEYPATDADSRVGGAQFSFLDGENADWDRVPGHPSDFGLKLGKDPATAIDAVFVGTDVIGADGIYDNTTLNYCDHVVHVIHLEALVDSLGRTHRRAELVSHGSEIKIITGWKSNSAIGSGAQSDPYFTRGSVRLDELVPGDHIKVKNHPLYRAMAGPGDVWQLENSVVGRIRGTRVPNDIEVQGHGLGPYTFRQMQAELVQRTRRGLIWAIAEIETSRAIPNALAAHASGFPYVHAFHTRRGGHFDAPIEFRNEFFNRGKGAFSLRWLIKSTNPFLLEEGANERHYLLHRNIGHDDPKVSDRLVENELWNLPWIGDLRVDSATGRLELRGTQLRSDWIRSVYFVAMPRFYMDPGVTPRELVPMSAMLIAQLGHWTSSAATESEIEASALTFSADGSTLSLTIPSAFHEGEQFWTPVLRLSLFDTSVPELGRYLTNELDYASRPLRWFDLLDDTDEKLAFVKDVKASLEFDIRSPMAFHWPLSPGTTGQVGFTFAANQNVPGLPLQYEVEGHNLFNVVYFSLYRPDTSGGYRPVHIQLDYRNDGRLAKKDPLLTAGLGDYFNEYAAHGRINAIRPK